jgi:hypothetical protein
LYAKDDMRTALTVLLQPGVIGAVVLQNDEKIGWLSLQAVQNAGCGLGEPV